MEVKSFVISPIQSNCYVISESLDPGAQAVVIDPGDTALDPVFQYIDAHQFKVVANWNTHAHFDHVLGVDVLRRQYHIPAYVHALDVGRWQDTPNSVATWLGTTAAALGEPDGFFADGDVLTLGDESFTVWHTPGHSPGSVCFVSSTMAFTGDTVFRGTVGRTDLVESDPQAMEDSLRRILTWSDALTLYPGHGPDTTMEQERQQNRFLRLAARSV